MDGIRPHDVGEALWFCFHGQPYSLFWVEPCFPKGYVGAYTHSEDWECGLRWAQGLSRGNCINIRSLGGPHLLSVTPNGKRGVLNLQQEGASTPFSCPANGKHRSSVNETPLNSYFPPKNFHLEKPIPISPFLYKNSLPSLICQWSTITCLSWTAITLIISEQTHFAGKVTGCFIFEADST